MRIADHGRVRPLSDMHDTGHGGLGYGGQNLYVVCLVDCFDPPRYVVRADNVSDALEVAEHNLGAEFDGPADEAEHVVHTVGGRTIWSDQDFRVSFWRGANRDA